MTTQQLIKASRGLVLLLVLAMIAAACGGGTSEETTPEPTEGAADTTVGEDDDGSMDDEDSDSGDDSGDDSGEDGEASGEPIHVGHITYHTGAFSEVGPFFDCATDFALGVINEDPPLGREMVQVSQDIGTVGEAQGVRNLIENEGVEVLFGPAHEYASYQDFLLNYVAENEQPLLPSIHGGSVPRELGGTHEEPIMRGAPMDSDQAVAAVLHAAEQGAETVAIVATEISGSQLQKDAAIPAAEELGLEVVLELDVQPEAPTYRSEVNRIASADPDALILFSQLEDGGTMVRQAAEAGLSTMVIGTTEWLQSQFPEVATMSAIEQHESVEIVGFANTEGEAWEEYAPRWEESECEQYADPQNSYAFQYYDILVVTALAIEQAGEVNTTEWLDAMYDVSMDGTKVHTYADGIEAIRNGEDIDYDGVSGEYNYTDTGVVSGLYGLFEWTSLEDLERVDTIEGADILELAEATAG